MAPHYQRSFCAIVFGASPPRTLAVLPHGLMFHYLSRRVNPNACMNVMPPEVVSLGEDTVLSAFERTPPDVVVVNLDEVSRSGLLCGGEPFAPRIAAWLYQRHGSWRGSSRRRTMRCRDALVANYAGDEAPSTATQEMIMGFILSPDPRQQNLGMLLAGIWTDLWPADNDLVVPFQRSLHGAAWPGRSGSARLLKSFFGIGGWDHCGAGWQVGALATLSGHWLHSRETTKFSLVDLIRSIGLSGALREVTS